LKIYIDKRTAILDKRTAILPLMYKVGIPEFVIKRFSGHILLQKVQK